MLLQLPCYTRATAALKLPCCLHQQQVSAFSPSSTSGGTLKQTRVRQLYLKIKQRYLRLLVGCVSRCERFLAVTTSRQHVALLLGPQIAQTPAAEHKHQPINACCQRSLS